MTNAIKITATQATTDKKQLNHEWIELTNEGTTPFNAEGCMLTTAVGGGRQRDVTTLKAGVVLQPGERLRLVTGSAGKQSHGEAPSAEGVRNVHLFLKAPYLERPGLTLRLVNHAHQELCRAVHAPN